MHLTAEDINRMTEEFRSRLSTAATDIPAGPMSLSEMQDWMVKNNVENPEVLRLLLDKQGQGGGKKKLPNL